MSNSRNNTYLEFTKNLGLRLLMQSRWWLIYIHFLSIQHLIEHVFVIINNWKIFTIINTIQMEYIMLLINVNVYNYIKQKYSIPSLFKINVKPRNQKTTMKSKYLKWSKNFISTRVKTRCVFYIPCKYPRTSNDR